MNKNLERQNPFFVPYDTPHDVAPFDCIRLEDFEEAFMEGIRRDDEQIEKVINDPRKPTFDNTIISIDDEKDGRAITTCWAVCPQYSSTCSLPRPTTRWMPWPRS